DMLAAEGYIRTGNNAAAVTLINVSRARAGLAPVTTSGAPANTAGSNDCVPKLPNGTCGSLLEAMKYEKRMETMFTGYMIWFTDSRGWGDLPQNTATEWPVPYQEMQARLQPYYNGSLKQTAASTYGF
ncbi:MAG: RagB/SusD family nutrient uptake outer membrane protein, partial [Gemmatimonadota bacterium]